MKVIYLIGLKIVELAALVFVPYLVGLFCAPILGIPCGPMWGSWLVGLGVLYILSAGTVLLFALFFLAIPAWFRFNLRWAKRLSKDDDKNYLKNIPY